MKPLYLPKASFAPPIHDSAIHMTAKTLICYGTRYGTTSGIVEEMAKTARDAGAEVDVIELKKNLPEVNPGDYDLVIVGSGIQAGQWKKEPLKFIESNLSGLTQTRLALFVVCGDAGNPELCDTAQADYLDKVAAMFPSLTPVSTGLFGGMFDFKRYNFVVRALVKRIVKSRSPPGEEVPETMDFRDWDKIQQWIRELVQ
jgi:menaquinone-dependent protoporphyrinogen oxidase